MYSTNVESNATSMAPEVGIVENVERINVSIPEGQEMLTFEFKQANGAVIRHTEFPANPDFNVDLATQAKDCSRRVKHIATKVMSEDEFVAFKNKAKTHKMTLDDIHLIINKDQAQANVAQNAKQDMLNQMKNVQNMPTSASGANSQGQAVSEERDVFNSILGNDNSVDNLFG